MPEYFEGKIEAPKPIVTIGPGDPSKSIRTLKRALETQKLFTVSYMLSHLSATNTAGYIFIVAVAEDGMMEVRDLADTVKFKMSSTSDLLDLIEHSAGIKYSELWYQKLYAKRNDRAN
jgi:hypothetical protein